MLCMQVHHIAKEWIHFQYQKSYNLFGISQGSQPSKTSSDK